MPASFDGLGPSLAPQPAHRDGSGSIRDHAQCLKRHPYRLLDMNRGHSVNSHGKEQNLRVPVTRCPGAISPNRRPWTVSESATDELPRRRAWLVALAQSVSRHRSLIPRPATSTARRRDPTRGRPFPPARSAAHRRSGSRSESRHVGAAPPRPLLRGSSRVRVQTHLPKERPIGVGIGCVRIATTFVPAEAVREHDRAGAASPAAGHGEHGTLNQSSRSPGNSSWRLGSMKPSRRGEFQLLHPLPFRSRTREA